MTHNKALYHDPGISITIVMGHDVVLHSAWHQLRTPKATIALSMNYMFSNPTDKRY